MKTLITDKQETKMLDKTYRELLDLIKASLWNSNCHKADRMVFEEMKQQTIAALPACIIQNIKMPEDLLYEWKKTILNQLGYTVNYKYAQQNLKLSVPYVILKGTSAAQYYPCPDYRMMGDIDIITSRKDFFVLYQELLDNGYQVINQKEREITFKKDEIVVELHRFFASLNNPKHARYLDDLIIQNITPSHILPDMINGLVLLEHISQHLEHGLGLRQIVDWMMFVDKCLPDEKWSEFEELAKNIGLDKLAVITTRMCELYLGLPKREWCKTADESICDSLMDFILSCGNFGNKWRSDKDISKTVITYVRGPFSAYKWFQERGLINWKAAQKYALLRPFAWVYQAGRYLFRGLRQDGSVAAISEEYREAKKRVALFNELGVKQKSKGLVVYRDGKYVKK